MSLSRLLVVLFCGVTLAGCGDVLGIKGGNRYHLVSIDGKRLPLVEFVSKSPDSPRPDTTWILDAQITFAGDSASVSQHMLVQRIVGGTVEASSGAALGSVHTAGDSIWFVLCIPDAGCGREFPGVFQPGRLQLRETFWEDTAYEQVVWEFDRR